MFASSRPCDPSLVTPARRRIFLGFLVTVSVLVHTNGCAENQNAAVPEASETPSLVGVREKREEVHTDEPIGRTLTVQMTYRDEGFPLGLAAQQSYTEPWTQRPFDQIPASVPAGAGRRYYGRLLLGDQSSPNRLVFVIDDNRPTNVAMHYQASSAAKELLEAPCTGESGFAAVVDLRLDYPAQTGNRQLPYRLWFFMNVTRWRTHTGGFYARCHRRGICRIFGEHYALVLFDNPANGDYADDPVFIDLNHDDHAQENEKFYPGSVVRLGNYEWTLERWNATGEAIRLIRK